MKQKRLNKNFISKIKIDAIKINLQRFTFAEVIGFTFCTAVILYCLAIVFVIKNPFYITPVFLIMLFLEINEFVQNKERQKYKPKNSGKNLTKVLKNIFKFFKTYSEDEVYDE